MRVFENKWFNRWARRENISDLVLFNAATDIAAGKADADLGGCLFKKRARAGGGKRGGYRTIVGYKKPNADRIIFLYAFAKSQKSDISIREESALSLVAEAFVLATDRQVNELVANGSIWEVHYHE